MNLIEQLGGYDQAKALHQAQLKTGLQPYGYEEAFLEYRREHNIFEVGDWVVYTGRANDADLYCLKEVYNEHSFAVGSNGADKDFWTLFVEEIRHATDAEIKAGKQLEVGDENVSNHRNW